MPGKTQASCSQGCWLSGSFELVRALVSQRGVKPEPVVVLLDELLEVGVQLIEILVFVHIDLLALEGLDEALAEGVVVGVAGAAHAGQDAVDLEQFGVLLGGVLHAAIGVVHQPGSRLAQGDGALNSQQF